MSSSRKTAQMPRQRTTLKPPIKPGAPVGNANATKPVTLSAVLGPIKCLPAQLAEWQARAEATGVPFAEHVRRALNAYVP